VLQRHCELLLILLQVVEVDCFDLVQVRLWLVGLAVFLHIALDWLLFHQLPLLLALGLVLWV
jgi:hypothetical protein